AVALSGEDAQALEVRRRAGPASDVVVVEDQVGMAVPVEVGDLQTGDSQRVVKASGGRDLRKGVGNGSLESPVSVAQRDKVHRVRVGDRKAGARIDGGKVVIHKNQVGLVIAVHVSDGIAGCA